MKKILGILVLVVLVILAITKIGLINKNSNEDIKAEKSGRKKFGATFMTLNNPYFVQLNEGIKEEIDKHNLNLIGVVPMDEMIYEYDSSGIPLVNLPEDSKAKIAINDIMAKLELN